MIFTLEALRAAQGDSLLLHYGPKNAPLLAVIDGGPSGVYKRWLRPRLEALRASRSPDAPLPLKLLAVSHIDGDHIQGVLDLLGPGVRAGARRANAVSGLVGGWRWCTAPAGGCRDRPTRRR